MNIRPTSDNVVIKTIKAEAITASGLVLAGDDKNPTQEATVVAVGPGRILENGTRTRPEVEVGQTVIVPRKLNAEITIDGVKHYVVNEGEILAVFGPQG
jgi:chaperonin GroES